VRKRLTQLLALAVALTGAGCGSSSSSGLGSLAPGAPIEIGYLASLTGFCATFSEEYVRGAQLAVRTINGRGGVLGHPLELLIRDDRDTPSAGVREARDLVLGQHVRYLAGTCSSAVAKSVVQLVADPLHVLYVVGAVDPSVFAGGSVSYAFDTIPTATTEGQMAAAFVRAHPRWKRVAVIGEDYSYGYEVTAAFKAALAGSGQTIVSQDYVPSGGSDYRSYISKLIAEHPEVVYSTVISEDALTLVGQALPLGLFRQTKYFGVLDYGTMDAMARPPLGAYGYTYYPSASIYHTPFAAALAKFSPADANGGAAGDGFNQVQIIAQGIADAHSIDPTAVRDALGGATVQTVQGNVKIPRCSHLTAMPIAMGPVAPKTKAQPRAHFEPLRFIDTTRYLTC
jgi:ABC-type branched-subunit amino acid transport system substrate-binding protein